MPKSRLYLFLSTLVVLVTTSFLLHLVWENSHVHLYTNYTALSWSLPITVWASIGDVFYTLGAVLFVSVLKRKFDWVSKPGFSDFFVLAFLGFSIALLVEYKALLFDRWDYAEAMPIVPLLNVGLSPVLQMVLFLPLSVYLTSLIGFVFLVPKTEVHSVLRTAKRGKVIERIVRGKGEAHITSVFNGK